MDIDGTPTGIIHARLTVDLDSGRDKVGVPVRAVLTEPLLTKDRTLVIFPEGSEMSGTVTFTRRARWFARNGSLRFTFRSIQIEGRAGASIHGQLAASEAARKRGDWSGSF